MSFVFRSVGDFLPGTNLIVWPRGQILAFQSSLGYRLSIIRSVIRHRRVT